MTKSVYTLDKKHTALIKQKFGVGEAKLEQAHEGSANEDHFANNQWGSLLQKTNQTSTRNVKRAIKTSDMALLLMELLVESLAIAILDTLIDCEFQLTHCSLP